jgi:hypothetical protein
MLPVPQEPATKRQLKRLANLEVEHPVGITADEAKTLIQEAEAQLPPTPSQLKKAAAARLSLPDGATRATVEGLLDDHDRRRAIAALRRKGVSIADDADWEVVWDADEAVQEAAEEAAELRKRLRGLRGKGFALPDNLSSGEADEWESAWDELERIMREVRSELGVEVTLPADLSLEGARELESQLYAMSEAASTWEAMLEWMEDRGTIPRVPKKRERRSVMPQLWERVRAKTWHGSDEDDLWLAQRALQSGGIASSEVSRVVEAAAVAQSLPRASPEVSQHMPREATREARDSPRSSWWRRLFGG